jgi:hypothetical protein
MIKLLYLWWRCRVAMTGAHGEGNKKRSKNEREGG